MRILLVTNLFPPDVLGGYELVARDVAEQLARLGHEVHVLTTGDAREADSPRVHRDLELVRPFGEPGRLDRLRHARAKQAQEAALERVLNEHGPFDAALMMSLRRLGLHVPRRLGQLGIPAVWCFNDDWLLAHKPADGANAVKRVVWGALELGPLAARTWRGLTIERAVYISRSTRDQLREGGAPVPDGVIQFQGIDLGRFPARECRPLGDAPKLLYAGRLHPTKGVDRAIEALSQLRRAGVRATLSIAGTGAAEELERLRALADELRVSEHVRWLGFVDPAELPAVYRDHDVFLFPSIWKEPAGLTYLEAMASGVPVVGFANGGAGELLDHQKNAMVAEGATELAAHVVRLMERPELVADLVDGGLSTVRERASLPAYVAAIEAELADAVHVKRGVQVVESQTGNVLRLRRPVLDAEVGAALRRAAEYSRLTGAERVIIDCSAVERADGDGFRALSNLGDQLNGVAVALAGVNGELARLTRAAVLHQGYEIWASPPGHSSPEAA